MDTELLERFSQIVEHGASDMRDISDHTAAEPRAEGKWSRKQIVGHLIDSAVNNQTRFVCAQLQDDLIFPGYDQDGWVRVQQHQRRPWPELIETWRAYNVQLAAIVRAIPPGELARTRPRHNLHEIEFQELPEGTPATLGFLVHDYVAHLEHHLRQILD